MKKELENAPPEPREPAARETAAEVEAQLTGEIFRVRKYWKNRAEAAEASLVKAREALEEVRRLVRCHNFANTIRIIDAIDKQAETALSTSAKDGSK